LLCCGNLKTISSTNIGLKPAGLVSPLPPTKSITVSGKSFLESLSSGPEAGISHSLCPPINHRSCHSQPGPPLSAWLQSLLSCRQPAVRGHAPPFPCCIAFTKHPRARWPCCRRGCSTSELFRRLYTRGERQTQWQRSYMFWRLHASALQRDAEMVAWEYLCGGPVLP